MKVYQYRIIKNEEGYISEWCYRPSNVYDFEPWEVLEDIWTNFPEKIEPRMFKFIAIWDIKRHKKTILKILKKLDGPRTKICYTDELLI